MRALRLLSPVAVSGLLLLAGCGDTAVAALRVDVGPDFGGSVVLSSLLVPDGAGPTERGTRGVAFTHRANLYGARGTFARVDDLAVGDLTFLSGTTEAGFSYLEVTLPRGAAAAWPALMAPSAEQRDAAESTVDPRGELGDAAGTVALEVDVPGDIMGSHVSPQPRGVTTDHTRRRASLRLPVARARDDGQAMVWLITWR